MKSFGKRRALRLPFKIIYHPDCLRQDIPKLDPPLLRRIKQTIENRLASAPMDFGRPLRHTREGLWSLRVGDWRVIYTMSGNRVEIQRIGHRREVYFFL